jgi:hypothetical protein
MKAETGFARIIIVYGHDGKLANLQPYFACNKLEAKEKNLQRRNTWNKYAAEFNKDAAIQDKFKF